VYQPSAAAQDRCRSEKSLGQEDPRPRHLPPKSIAGFGQVTRERRSTSQPPTATTCVKLGKMGFFGEVPSREVSNGVRLRYTWHKTCRGMPCFPPIRLQLSRAHFCIAPAWLEKKRSAVVIGPASTALSLALCGTKASCDQPIASISYRRSLFNESTGYQTRP
jgi:hypothetical protein